MKSEQTNILIIGAGLTGLTLAYLLRNDARKVTLLEARDRIGGRILTHYPTHGAPQEMGATWLGKKHLYLNELLKELGLGIFEQTLGKTAIYEPLSTSPPQLVTLPPNDDPSYRIQGGTSTLTQALAGFLQPNQVQLNQCVKQIRQTETGLEVTTQEQTIAADYVISTLPPYLLKETVLFEPRLPEDLLNIATKTHTWMGESIKVSLSYAEPFWRNEQSSGTIFSNVGPIPEMYDHSDYADQYYALKGFFNGAYYSISREERLAMVVNQLEKYFGPAARNFTEYSEAVWANEPFTYVPYATHVLPHQHNGHPVYRAAYLGGKLFVAGTETAAQHPGYMEGAVQSARFIAQAIAN